MGDLRFGERVGFEAVGGVIVDVDEAGGEDEASSFNYSFIGFRFEIRGDSGDAVFQDADIELAKRGAGAVGNLAVADENRGVVT